MNLLQKIFGDEREAERETIVAHEAGHTLMAWFSPYVSDVPVVSISLRRNSVTHYVRIGTGTTPPPASWSWDEACIGLGGIAAEMHSRNVANPVHSRGDLVRARDVLSSVLERHGLASCPWGDAATGLEVDIGEMFKEPAPTEVRVALNLAFAHAVVLLRRHRQQYEAICGVLREQGHLLAADLTELLGDRPWKLFF